MSCNNAGCTECVAPEGHEVMDCPACLGKGVLEDACGGGCSCCGSSDMEKCRMCGGTGKIIRKAD